MSIQMDMMIRYIILILALVWANGAWGADDPAQDFVITLERTACYGSCPVYKLTIRGDGSVIYEGHKFVRVEGTRQIATDPAKVLELAHAFLDAGYFELKDRYTGTVTDLPTVYTSIRLGNQYKTIEDYYGAPEELKELEHKIDELAGSKRWVEIDAASVHEEARHGWNVNSFDARKQVVIAAERGDADVIRAFIEEGADMTFRMGDMTPLQLARGVEVVKLLISAGADVNATSKDHFGPPLVEAAELGDTETIQALIDAGAKVNKRSPDGETALMKAARSGIPSAVRVLLQAGSDVKARDADGYNAIWHAQAGLSDQTRKAEHPNILFSVQIPDFANKYKEIEDMLKAAGAEYKTKR